MASPDVADGMGSFATDMVYSDLGLSIEYWLPWVADGRVGQEYAVKWAYQVLGQHETEAARELFAVCAWAAYAGHLVRRYNNTFDSDVREISSTFECLPATDVKIRDMILKGRFCYGPEVKVMFSAKVNFWLRGQHIVNDKLSGDLRKLHGDHFSDIPEKNFATAARIVGRWISTRHVLKLAGIPGILETDDASITEIHELLPNAEDITRFKGLPYGAHRMAVAFAGACRLIQSPIVLVCPNPTDFNYLPGLYISILKDPGKYHPRAYFLTGHDKIECSDEKTDRVLGRIGSYIHTVLESSALSKCPCVSLANVRSYADFDAVFFDACKVWKNLGMKWSVITSLLTNSTLSLVDDATIRSIALAWSKEEKGMEDFYTHLKGILDYIMKTSTQEIE